MARKPFPKQSPRVVSINVRDVSKYLHLQMRLIALERNVSLGSLYNEALKIYLAHEEAASKEVA